ncbi:MAG: hypothetical protein HC773_21335 [Scytonema sp. CRU_2_7]|nr:hypothetical protein [Scytonema sp. CRU_2_7]
MASFYFNSGFLAILPLITSVLKRSHSYNNWQFQPMTAVNRRADILV